MADLGQAYVQIIPKAEGISGKIEGALTPGVDKAGSKAGGLFAGKLQKGLSGNTSKIFAPLVSGLAAAFSVKAITGAFTEVHGGLENIIKKTGATGEALEDMREILSNVTGSIPTDFATAGDAIGEVNTRFGSTGKELEKLSSAFIKFADLNGTDVTNAVDSTQKALAAFGLKAKDAEGLLDVLNKTGQSTGVSVETLTNGLVQNGTAFQKMGLSIEDAVALMGQMELSGANSETVMNGLRKALKNSAKDGVELTDALADMQDAILNGKDGVDGLTYAYDLFGRSGDQIYGAVQNGTLDFQNLGAAAEDAGGSVADTFNATLTPADNLRMKLNELKDKVTELADKVIQKLTPYWEKAKEIWDKVKPSAGKLWEACKNLASAVGDVLKGLLGIDDEASTTDAVVSALTTLFENAAKVVQFFADHANVLVPVLAAVTAGVVALNVAMWVLSANPIVLAIAGIIAAITLLIMNWDKLKERAVKSWNQLKNSAILIWRGIRDTVVEIATKMKEMVIKVIEACKKAATNIWNGIKTAASSIWNGIKTAVMTPINAVKDFVTKAFSKIKETATNIWNGIKNAIVTPITAARDIVKGIIDRIKGFFNFSWSLPHLKLPHFSISPAGWKIGDLLKGSIPKLGISWYAKGGIVDGATLIGAGEAGPEMITPLSGRYMQPFAKAIAEEMDGNNGNIVVNLNYDASDDATDLLRDLARGIRRYRRAGAF